MEKGDKLEQLLKGVQYANPNFNYKPLGHNSDLSVELVNKSKQFNYTNLDLGLTIEEMDEATEMGISPNPYINHYDFNKARAKNQSGFEQFGNFLVQAGYGEIMLGSLEGFGNIYDGLANLIKGGDYERSEWTKFFEEAKENVKQDFAIHRENPDQNFDFSDFGYWMSEGVNAFTTLSLMIPAAGWAKGISYIGNLTKLSKATNWATRGISKGLAKVGKTIETGNKYTALRNVSGRAGRIQNAINDWKDITTTAFLSRTGENFLESKDVYDQVYTESLDKLNEMDNNDFKKFLINNPEFNNKSKEEIAKKIATESADKTFYNDYAMLIQDVIHLKAIGSLLGKKTSKSSTARERIAAKNQKAKLAGAKEEQLIKDNIKNRIKENVSYALKHPINSVTANHIWEGFEEIYQGIQVEKGKEVGEKYFNPNLTPRSIESYLRDASIWEQGFWGMMGSVAFSAGRNIYKDAERKVQALWKKNHLTPEQYEIWKRSEDKLAATKLNEISDRAKKFVDDMEKLNNNENPLDYVIDPVTKKRVIQNGELVHTTIDDTQKELLQQEIIDKFVKDIALDGIDSGVFDLMTDILDSPEFDKFISDNNVKYTNNDKLLSKQIVDRMNDIAGVYYTALDDIYSINDVNPYVANVAARYIARKRFDLEDTENKILNIDNRINETIQENEDYQFYQESLIYESVKHALSELDKFADAKRKQFKDGEISQSALNTHLKNISKERKELLNYLTENTTKGSIEAIKEVIKTEDILDDDIRKEFNKFAINYENILYDNERNEIPRKSLKDLIDKKIALNLNRAYIQSTIPTDKQGIQDLYDDFALANDKISIQRIEDYIDLVKNYLRNAEDFDTAYKNILNENTGNRKLDDALNYLKYGYFDVYNEPRVGGQARIQLQFNQLLADLKKEREKINETIEDAANRGVVLPSTDESPSTGEVVIPNINEGNNGTTTENIGLDVAPNTTTQPVKKQSVVIEPGTDIAPDTQVIETPIDIDKEDDGVLDEESMKEAGVVDAAFRTTKNLARNDASVYITQAFFKQRDRMYEIANNPEKLKEFINEVIEFLTDTNNKRHYKKELAKKVAEEEFKSAISAFAAIDNNEVYAKLANDLARGFNEENAKSLSTTSLIDGEAIPEVLDKFLVECAELHNAKKNIQTGVVKLENGTYVVNLVNLFDYLLKNPKISRNTAIKVYNNLMKYLAINTESKFKFVAFANNSKLSAEEFFNELDTLKENFKFQTDYIHINPVEVAQRDEDYVNAIVAANNGSNTYIIEEKDANNKTVNLAVMVDIVDKKTKSVKTVKIGILRTVTASKNLDEIYEETHSSGFRNRIFTDKDGKIKLDCEDLFSAIINSQLSGNTDKEAKELHGILVDYYISMYSLKISYMEGSITDEELEEGLIRLMNEDTAKKILNNKHIKNVLDKGLYLFHSTVKKDVHKAKELAETLSTILFYGSHWGQEAILNVDYSSMDYNYEQWKEKVKNNYIQTKRIQDKLIKKDKVSIRISMPYSLNPHKISKDENPINVSEAGFQTNPRSRALGSYTPLVMVNKDYKLVDEHGNVLGNAPAGIGSYSMGYMVFNENGRRYISYCINSIPIQNEQLLKGLENELMNIIKTQLNNIDDSTHEDTFNKLINRLTELFGYGSSIFNLNNGLSLYVNDNKSFIIIGNAKTKVNYLTIYKNTKKGKNSNYISVLNDNNETQYININNDKTKPLIEKAIKTILKDVKLNKSARVFENSPSDIYRKNKRNGKFYIKLGNEELVYESYGDFIAKSGAFTTDMFADDEGRFVHKSINDKYLNINAVIKDSSDIEDFIETNVSDLLFVNRTPKTESKPVKTETILQYAGVEQDKIDILLGKNTGVKILVSEVYPSKSTQKESNDNKTNAFYAKEKNGVGKIYITPKGAASMNRTHNSDISSKEAIRLLVHENVHRVFQRKDRPAKEKERILNELVEVYDYLEKTLLEEFNNGTLDAKYGKAFGKSMINLFNVLNSYQNVEVRMEEFLAESLSQPLLLKYMNDVTYFEDVVIEGINNKNKSIFQKFIDILLKLFGINEGNIKNNSILAKQYLILSKTTETTSDNTGLFSKDQNKEKTKSKTENKESIETETKLNKVKNKVEKVINSFNERVTRSENFEEDHIYYIDGNKVEISVTQKVHGNNDLGDWKTPSTSLGNTADSFGREYFENNNNIDTNVKRANLTTEGERSASHLKEQFDKIVKYLDNKFGKGKYGVITKEFAIGGVIVENGVEKTIAGTMDMIVYTDNGDIYIFDFKTKRIGLDDANGDMNISPENIIKYSEQLNIYRQLIESNFPNLKGKIKLGGLIKFNVDYPKPSKDVEYRKNPNNKNQLQIKDGSEFVNIEDYAGTYVAPTIVDINDPNVMIDVKEKDYRDEIKPLPEKINTDNINIPGEELMNIEKTDTEYEEDYYDSDEFDLNDESDNLLSATELVIDGNEDMQLSSSEIYAPPIANGITDNAFGIKTVNNLNEFVESFPQQYRDKIRQILESDELNYTCS